jgi:hypothetical protein
VLIWPTFYTFARKANSWQHLCSKQPILNVSLKPTKTDLPPVARSAALEKKLELVVVVVVRGDGENNNNNSSSRVLIIIIINNY